MYNSFFLLLWLWCRTHSRIILKMWEYIYVQIVFRYFCSNLDSGFVIQVFSFILQYERIQWSKILKYCIQCKDFILAENSSLVLLIIVILISLFRTIRLRMCYIFGTSIDAAAFIQCHYKYWPLTGTFFTKLFNTNLYFS